MTEAIYKTQRNNTPAIKRQPNVYNQKKRKTASTQLQRTKNKNTMSKIKPYPQQRTNETTTTQKII